MCFQFISKSSGYGSLDLTWKSLLERRCQNAKHILPLKSLGKIESFIHDCTTNFDSACLVVKPFNSSVVFVDIRWKYRLDSDSEGKEEQLGTYSYLGEWETEPCSAERFQVFFHTSIFDSIFQNHILTTIDDDICYFFVPEFGAFGFLFIDQMSILFFCLFFAVLF